MHACVRRSVGPSVRCSVVPSVRPPARPSVRRSARPPVRRSVCRSICPCARPSARPPASPPAREFVLPSTRVFARPPARPFARVRAILLGATEGTSPSSCISTSDPAGTRRLLRKSLGLISLNSSKLVSYLSRMHGCTDARMHARTRHGTA